MMARDFRQLQVWQKSHEFVMEVYRQTQGFPQEELYGLKSQMRRAAVSVPSNIAEGCGRGGATELARFARIAQGSNSEIAYQILLAGDLRYIAPPVVEDLAHRAQEVGRMLTAFNARLSE